MLMGRYTDYRAFLSDELEKRIQANSRYSLRAFARDLEIAPQVLSLVLKKKKGISAEVAARIASRLGLSFEESSYLHDLVQLVHARSEAVRKIAEARLAFREEKQSRPEYLVLQEEYFKVISDWYHYALFELTLTDDFRNDPAWIASRLGITKLEVTQAIQRLLRLGLLEEVGGKLQKTAMQVTTTRDVPSAAIRRFNLKVLEKAQLALQLQDVHERDFSTMTMALDPARLPEAKKMIREFRRKLTSVMESGARKEVYVFAAQLFRLSQMQNKNVGRSKK